MTSNESAFAEETRIVHGIKTCHTTSKDLVPPIHMTSTFRFESIDDASGVFAGTESGYLYTRVANPTVDLLQEKMAVLEGGENAIATSSGMAAVAAVVMSVAKPGDNVVMCNAVYGGTFALFANHLKDFKITARFISPHLANERSRVETLIDDNTRMLFIETPANPTLDVINIELWSDIAKKSGIPLVVDNTFSSPFLQKPLSLGADMVVHSATKYLSGHGDIIGGIIVGSRDMMDTIRERYTTHFGPAMSPFNAWLVMRGIKTLAVRMECHSASALKIARWLQKHPKVKVVHYPGLTSHPFHRIAASQMKNFSGIMAFEIRGGMDAGKNFLNSLKLCLIAVSLGDCETLIQHPASMTHSTYSREELKKAGIPQGLIRLSVGLEHPDDIIADLSQAFSGSGD